jgi:alternate signal-mediated exported protein
MRNKKKLILILALITLVALTSVTIAYFLAKDEVKNSFTVGDLTVDVQEPGWEDPKVWQGEEVAKIANVKNINTMPEIIRVAVEPRWEDANGNFVSGDINLVEFQYANITTDPTVPNSWYDGKDGYYYYTSIVPSETSTSDIIKSVKFNVPDSEKDKYNTDSLKAVVRAEALFSSVQSWKTDWTVNNGDVIALLTSLTK